MSDLRGMFVDTSICTGCKACQVACKQWNEMAPGVPLPMEDEDAVRQLLWILLDNALRHSRTRVSITLALEGEWARMVVADDGSGIAQDDRERVFERFYQADPARAGQGAGLGLSIARWIVDQHRGRILAGESAAGGAAMYIDLPLRASGDQHGIF